MPRKKFNKEAAGKIWANYTKNLVDSISDTEKEGAEKGMSSYEIERLWQERTREKTEGKKGGGGRKGQTENRDDEDTDSSSQSTSSSDP